MHTPLVDLCFDKVYIERDLIVFNKKIKEKNKDKSYPLHCKVN